MNSTEQPKVSILIPSYNHSKYIEQTIRSVWEQAYSNLELIVVDDGSSDDSRGILARLQLISPITMIVIEQENAGICLTLNRALEKSTGEIIGFLASDDVMLPDRLNQEVCQFKQKPLLKVLYTNGRFKTADKIFGDVHKNIKSYLKRGFAATRDHLLTTAPGFYIQTMLIKREFLLSLGGFDVETGSDDWSLNIRIFKTLKSKEEFLFIDRFSFVYRIHQNQIHRGSGFMSPMKKKVVRKFFTLENRSKFICQTYAKKAFGLCLERKFNQARRYISKASYIAFSSGIPFVCLIKFSFELPGYTYREIIRRLKT